MSDIITVQVGNVGRFILSIPEATDLQRQLDHKLGKRYAATAQYVVEPRHVIGEHERPPVDPEFAEAVAEVDKQMQLDLEPDHKPAPAPVINHFDMSTQLFHD